MDGRVHVVLQKFQNDGGEVGGIEELIPRVPLHLRPLPLDLVLPHQVRLVQLNELALDLRAGFSFAVKEAERGAEGRSRSGELERVTPAENPAFLVFLHGPILVRSAGLVKFQGYKRGQYLGTIGENSKVDELAFSLPLNEGGKPGEFKDGYALIRVLSRKDVNFSPLRMDNLSKEASDPFLLGLPEPFDSVWKIFA
jgi:hypothetical protein